ncbi:hypothetical protein EW026_g3354 [Hermanssonia centrifuga]|uniref:Uncharacterized protein n=1 Tax=Hermanssonia centrifuga TaxID=98765 RepID=A0A4S4KKF9_9APHY|nr:hypothetical protein EW026_g3354 [Hermanssonia centrifuga]
MSKFTPSPQEVALVNQIFIQADAQKLGVVNGDAAVKVFSGTKLSPTVLAEIWNLADDDNKGVLTRKDVAVAIRLLGHAQRGERVTEAHIHKPGPVPLIEGLNGPLSRQGTGLPTTKSPPPGAAAAFPPLTPQDKAKFMKLFLGCGPANGILPGEKARDVFVKSKLPVDKLSQIWSLADTKNRGALDATDFTIAMYLIQASMSGQIQVVPQTLPPYVYEQAKNTVEGVISHATGSSGSFSPSAFGGFPGRPTSAIQPQFTGQAPLQPQSTGHRPTPPLPARSVSIPAFPLAPQATGQLPQWDVTPTEKATSDQFFDTLDTQKRGLIEGEVAVPFMVQSKLSDDVLAQIWRVDLSDLNNDGHLTRDGFAVAMHLIQAKLAGKDVPATLPPTLIPPSMRATAFPPPSHPPVSDVMRDLLWDDTPPPSAQQPVSPFPPPQAGTISPQHTAQPTTNFFAASDPFANSSFIFLTYHVPPSAHKDLLGDDDEPVAASPPLQDKSAEIGNTQNQLHSTNRALETSRNERVDLERKLSEQAAQLSALQTQLSSAKAAYETETRLLTTLRERFSSQTADIQKTRQELIHAESDLSAIRVEKAEVEGSFLRDKEEVRELQRKMTEQLATREAERTKWAKESEEAQHEADSIAKEREQAEAELATPPETTPTIPERVASPVSVSSVAFAASHALPVSPEAASPALSGKSTNPFERLAFGSPPRSQSPFLPFSGSAVQSPMPTGASPAPQAVDPPAADPFGFEEAFGADEHSPSGEPESSISEPTTATTESSGDSPFGASEAPGAATGSDITSPTDTDLFITPPTTATMQVLSQGEATSQANDDQTEPVTAASPNVEMRIPGHFSITSGNIPDRQEGNTDLDHQLKELDPEESDSDSDSDNEPLTSVKAKLQPHGAVDSEAPAGSSSAFDDSFGISSSMTAKSPDVATPSAGTSTLTTVPTTSSVTPTAEPIAVTSPPDTPPAPAGVSDFDEALGKLSGSGTSQFSHVSQFTFDSAFEDDFDFAAAKAATASSSSPITNGNTVLAPSIPAFPPVTQPHTNSGFDAAFLSQPSSEVAPSPAAAISPAPAIFPSVPASTSHARPFSFDDVFGSAVPAQPSLGASVQPAPSGAPDLSFDNVFGGTSASDALALDNSFSSSAYQPPAGSPPAQKGTAFPAMSPPSSPTHATSSRSRRSPSPPTRQMSPPPRNNSPKPRPSTASSEKEKSTRHSKLSIRLPFGRKKNKQDPMPSHLSQSHMVEEPPSGATPAAEDDLDAVKTLCSMGFSRTQAVTALEQYDYDVQRALNSLLGE